MIRMLFIFLFLAAVFGTGITIYRNLKGKEKIQLIKLIGFSIICSTLSLFTLFFIVILF